MENYKSFMSIEEIKELHKNKFEEYSNFIKAERDKGEGISKKTLWILLNSFCLKKTGCLLDKYSSGKKKYQFSEVFGFFRSIFTETSEIIDIVYFCKEEIDSYARSYRVLDSKFTNFFEKDSKKMVKVFEFKPDKI